MNPLFTMDHVSVFRGKREVIRNISFSIRPGEFCGLLGLNGSGKTTLLQGACGFLPITGTCTAAGRDCGRLHERKRARLMAFIPQVCSLEGGRTGLEAVMMGYNPHLRLLASPSAAQKANALAAMEKLGCLEYAHQDFGTLSQGQRQAVILARCIVQNTPVMLMDEPDSALDFLNKHTILGKIRAVIHEEGKAGLITLHDPNFAMAYCDRLLLLRDGQLVGEITMADASQEEIQKKLSYIYGDITLLKSPGGYLMGR